RTSSCSPTTRRLCCRRSRRSRRSTRRCSGTEMERLGPRAIVRTRELPGRRGIDWTAPFSIAMMVLLAVLVLLPMYWLLVTSLRGDGGAFTLEHYRHLFV